MSYTIDWKVIEPLHDGGRWHWLISDRETDDILASGDADSKDTAITAAFEAAKAVRLDDAFKAFRASKGGAFYFHVNPRKTN